MSTLSFSLSDHDIRRIAETVAALLEPPVDPWLDVSKASEYTSLTAEAIRMAHKRGKLRGHKGLSGRLVFRRSMLDEFMSGEV